MPEGQPSPTTAPASGAEVFISYASEDERAAKRVCAALEPEGLQCWMAPRDIPPGGDWVQSIMRAIGSTKLLVLIFSAASNGSGHVLREVERAIHRDLPLLPVRVDETVPDGNLAYFVSGSHWFDAPGGEIGGRAPQLVRAARDLIRDPSIGWAPVLADPGRLSTSHRVAKLAALLLAVGLASVAAAVLALGGDGSAGRPEVRLTAEDARWSASTGGPILSTPAISGDAVIVGSDEGSVYAFDVASGRQAWRVSTGAPVRSSPTVAGGYTYFGSFNGNVYSLRAGDGRERWVTPTGFEVFSSPAVSGQTMVIGAEGVLALDGESGVERWRFDTGGPVNSSPAIAGGVVYVGADDGSVYALDLETGDRIWRTRIGGPVNSSPAIADGSVYVGGGRGIFALDARSGKRTWRLDVPEGVNSSPTVAGGRVFFGARDGGVYSLDARTGGKQWTFRADDRVDSSPTVVTGTVYVGSNDGNVYGLDAETGARRWTFTAGAPVVASPVVAGHLVYIATDDGTVFAAQRF